MKAAYTAAFASGNYIVRSERYNNYIPPEPEPEPPKEPKEPKKKKPRTKRTEAGFIYKFFTVLVCILIWPVGLIMLLRRYLRWKAFSKFLTACITLACGIILYGFLLTVNTGNDTYAGIQDAINLKIEAAAAEIDRFSGVVEKKLTEVYDGADNLLRAVMDVSNEPIADAIDYGVEISRSVRTQISEWAGSLGHETGDSDNPAVTADPEETPTPRPTANPQTIKPKVDSSTIILPVYVPSGSIDPSSGNDLSSGTLTKSGITPTVTPKSDVEADEGSAEIVRSYLVKPAGSLTVYFNRGSGHYYHTASSCGSMKTAETHTLSEAIEGGFKQCSRCNPPTAEIMEGFIVWVDEKSVAHLTDTCESFVGKSKIVSASDAIGKGLTTCGECGSSEYLSSIQKGTKINIVDATQFS